jgi:hypothetical protein
VIRSAAGSAAASSGGPLRPAAVTIPKPDGRGATATDPGDGRRAPPQSFGRRARSLPSGPGAFAGRAARIRSPDPAEPAPATPGSDRVRAACRPRGPCASRAGRVRSPSFTNFHGPIRRRSPARRYFHPRLIKRRGRDERFPVLRPRAGGPVGDRQPPASRSRRTGDPGAFTFAGGRWNSPDPALVQSVLANRGAARYVVATPTSSHASLFMPVADQPAPALGGCQGWGRILTPDQLADPYPVADVRFLLRGATSAPSARWGR